jgi:hypothetical protein
VKLNPLIGDPLTLLAIPDRPDLAIGTADIGSNADSVLSTDTSLVIRLRVHNYGLVPSDSVTVRLTDRYAGPARTILDDVNISPVLHVDSLTLPWSALDERGLHTLTATLDPANAIQEVSEANNSVARDEYIYATEALVVRPLDNAVLLPGRQRLVLAMPGNGDSASVSFEFELDTVETFDSPALLQSGQITPGPVMVQWETPVVESGRLYFWRVRTVRAGTVSQWKISSFSVADNVPQAPTVRLRQFSKRQFGRQILNQAVATDTGVTIARSQPVRVYARSLGYRADANKDYYSILEVDEQTMTGLWWVHGNSFLVARVDGLTGEADFRSFNVASQASQADEMVRYLNQAPDGDYLALTVVFDGQSNVSDTLRALLRGLGSVYIDSLAPGHSWILLARKGSAGAGAPTREQWSVDGVAEDSLVVPSYFSLGTGEMTTDVSPIPQSWDRLQWNRSYQSGKSSVDLHLLGLRKDGEGDTLRRIDPDSTVVDLGPLTVVTEGDTNLASFMLSSVLSRTRRRPPRFMNGK